MNPGLVVKLRPSGPWRIGPDSGARNRVDVVYHSDSLFSAVTSAMARLGHLDAWLDSTARAAAPAVCFGSCFPFLGDTGFVVPPRTLWPPASPALMAAHVRWKSARFVPLEVVRAILAGEALDENRWAVDGPSGCLVPAGVPGPFRTSVRWNAAIDRLTGTSERHSIACIEFRPGAGLWTAVSFASEETRDTWQDTVKAAFRLLADTGLGGERSRGWGRSLAPEFIEGELPALVLGRVGLPADDTIPEPPPEAELAAPLDAEPEPSSPIEPAPSAEPEPVLEAELSAPPAGEPLAAEPERPAEPEPVPEAELAVPPEPEPQPAATIEPEPATAPLSVTPQAPAPAPGNAHWLLSVFVPAAADAVDWSRGSYSLIPRGGRVESPAGSGGLKKQIQMIAEGSVVVADGALLGAAPDVAPDGFPHPVFRAGFALSIPLPEGN